MTALTTRKNTIQGRRGAVMVETSVVMLVLVMFFLLVIQTGLSMSQMIWVDSTSYQLAARAAEGGEEGELQKVENELFSLHNNSYRRSPLAGLVIERDQSTPDVVRVTSQSTIRGLFTSAAPSLNSHIEVAKIPPVLTDLTGLDTPANGTYSVDCCGLACSGKDCGAGCVSCAGDSCTYDSSGCGDKTLVSFEPEPWDGK